MIRAALFGGCNLRGPFHRVRKAEFRKPGVNWDDVSNEVKFAGIPYFAYTLGEMLQSQQLYRGERYIPREVRTLCGIPIDFYPNPKVALKYADVLLIEPATSIEIIFEGYFLNRARVLTFLKAISKVDREAIKLTQKWYSTGICHMKHDIRIEIAEEIIAMIPADFPDYHFTCAFLRNAHGSLQDVNDALRKFVDAADGTPIGIVTYTWAFMPDGRPVSWPADFYKKVVSAASELNIPILEPRNLVAQMGIERSLKSDLRHYTEEFQPIIAGQLTEFALAVAATSERKPKAVVVENGSPKERPSVQAAPSTQETPARKRSIMGLGFGRAAQ